MRCYVRLMCRGDIAQVTEIDREAFPTLWPPANYRKELNNPLAHYIVACDEEREAKEADAQPLAETRRSGLVSRVRQLFNYDRLLDNESTPSTREYIVGFAGFWVMADEAHMTSIAVREIHSCQGIGEMLLIALIELTAQLDANIITLEVRASNLAAQSLYYKYGFAQVGLHRGYYTNDREDGVLMTLQDITSDPFQARLQQLKQAYSEKWEIALNPVG